MPYTPISLGVRSNQGRDTAISPARLINCFAEDAGEEGKIRYPIVACDGFTSFATLVGAAAGVTRGMLNLDDTTLYVVTGTRLQRVDTAGAVTQMAELATSGYAYFARNRKEPNAQVGLVTSDGLFRMIENNSVSTPSPASGIEANLFNSICTVDGYFIFTKSNGEFYVSSIDAGSTIDELDFAQTQANPDGLTRGVVRGRDVCLFGPRSVEFWQNTGATDFPFERTTAAQIGLFAPASAVALSAVIDGSTVDTVAFVAANVTGDLIGVCLLGGYDARKISPPALDRAIRDEPTKSSIRAFTHTSGGHTFYCVTGTSFTWEYNCGTGLWHERRSSGLSRWRVVEACQFNGSTIFGDYTSALLYSRSAALSRASASTIAVRHSDDNGDNWTSSRSKSIGGSNASATRTKFLRLGQSLEDGKVFELTLSNAVMENGTGTDMIVIPPAVHAWPKKMRFFTLYVDCIPGASQTTGAMGITGLGVDAEVLA